MKIQENIRRNLKVFMKKRNLSLTEFAEELNISRSSLQNYLSGNSNPRSDTINLLAEKLNIPAEVLIADPDNAHVKSDDDTSLSLYEFHCLLKSAAADCYSLYVKYYHLFNIPLNDLKPDKD